MPWSSTSSSDATLALAHELVHYGELHTAIDVLAAALRNQRACKRLGRQRVQQRWRYLLELIDRVHVDHAAQQAYEVASFLTRFGIEPEETEVATSFRENQPFVMEDPPTHDDREVERAGSDAASSCSASQAMQRKKRRSLHRWAVDWWSSRLGSKELEQRSTMDEDLLSSPQSEASNNHSNNNNQSSVSSSESSASSAGSSPRQQQHQPAMSESSNALYAISEAESTVKSRLGRSIRSYTNTTSVAILEDDAYPSEFTAEITPTRGITTFFRSFRLRVGDQ